MDQPKKQWPPFNLTRLLRTVVAPKAGERLALLIDLPDPREIKNFRFLRNQALQIQHYAHDFFYFRLKKSGLGELNLRGGELFAYQITGGSNLDLPPSAMAPDGREGSFEKDINPNYANLLCLSTFSATAPLKAAAKRCGLPGASLPG